jgi:FkbM family methyltransferase
MLQTSRLYWYLKRKRRKANIRMGGYSQYGQDLACYDLLQQKKGGFFMDIGANDGITFSNSFLFEEKGWKGVCVEPHPIVFQTLNEKRSCHCLNACISEQDGIVDFLAVEGPAHMLSGIESFLSEDHLRRINQEISEKGGELRRIQIEAITPESLLKRYEIDVIDFLSVDTEGCELPILRSLLRSKSTPRPKVISVENGSRKPETFKYLTSIEYQLSKCVGCDEVYTTRV